MILVHLLYIYILSIDHCSDIEQMAQSDAAKTMPFLREKFNNFSLCAFRNNSAFR